MGVDVDSVIFVGKHTKDPRDFFTITGQTAEFHNWAYYW